MQDTHRQPRRPGTGASPQTGQRLAAALALVIAAVGAAFGVVVVAGFGEEKPSESQSVEGSEGATTPAGDPADRPLAADDDASAAPASPVDTARDDAGCHGRPTNRHPCQHALPVKD